MTIRSILLLALVVRVGWIALCPNEPVSDQRVYHVSATRLAAGEGYLDDSGHSQGFWPVGYSAILAAAYVPFGSDPVVAYGVNALCGLCLVVGVWKLAGDLMGPRAARVAACIAALHPTLVLYTTIVASENVYLPGSVALTIVMLRALRTPRGFAWAATAGAGAGLLAYVRPQAVLLAAVFVVGCWRRRTGWRRAVLGLGTITIVAFLVVLPWGLRNLEAFGRFNPFSSNGGVNLWMGNHAGSTGGYAALPPEVGDMGQDERDVTLGREAVRFIVSHPLTYLGLCVDRVVMTLRSDTISAVWNERGIERTFGEHGTTVFKVLGTAVHVLVWTIALTGAAIALARRSLSEGQAVLWAAIVASALPFVLVVGGNRYALPTIPFLVVLASGVLVGAGRRDEGPSAPERRA
ncbi:MAG: glycosyltransferase family 39 protein [Planctomycetes bacterium]|nr:glycosyltransferase family 39 protein [Planctomycetota bacterium]